MDRMYKAEDKVYVYSSRVARERDHYPVKVEHLVPYSRGGMDYYEFQGCMYPGYADGSEVYILLDKPMKGLGA